MRTQTGTTEAKVANRVAENMELRNIWMPSMYFLLATRERTYALREALVPPMKVLPGWRVPS